MLTTKNSHHIVLKEKLSTTQLHRLGWGWKELGQQCEKQQKVAAASLSGWGGK